MIVFLLLAFLPKNKAWFINATILAAAVAAVIGINSYTKNTAYLWPAEYRKDNELLAEYCRENYHENAVYGLSNAAVRGYVKMLFNRSVYENISKEDLKEQARIKGAEYAVLLVAASEPDPANVWNMYAFAKAEIYHLKDDSETSIQVADGKIMEEGNEGQ